MCLQKYFALSRQGFNKNEEFVVTQHPLEGTVDDFWRMVWDQNTATVVLLTDPELVVRRAVIFTFFSVFRTFYRFFLLFHTFYEFY